MAKFVCQVCGYVHEGDAAPEFCPVCKAPASRFTKVEENAEMVWAAEHVVDIENFAKAGSDVITVHTECDSDLDECIDLIHRCGKKAGLSVKPKTAPEALFPYLDKIEHILVMTVEPGFGGQSMMPDCLDKIAVIKAEVAARGLKNIPVMIDGGVNASNVRMAAEAGADMMVAGNAVFGASDRAAAFKELCRLSEI